MAFEAILAKPDEKPKRWRRVMLTVSLALHGVALTFGVIHSIWTVDEMPMPALQVTLTEAPPPPPPPPPPPAGAKKTSTKPKTKVVTKPTEIVQPKDTPKEEPEPEEPEEEGGEEGGVVGGEKGGVAGGVVGGVVGGVLGAPPPPPPKDTGPKMVSTGVGARQLVINPGSPPYCCPKIPKALERGGMQFAAQVRMCVSATGAVTDVRVMRGVGPAIDSQIPTYLRRWRYKPLMVDGRPTPFCYPLRYEIAVR